MLQIELPDPSFAEGVPIFGTAVNGAEFQGVMPHGLFKQKVPDPKKLEGAQAKYNSDLSEVATLRAKVNRLVTGAKKRNVLPYARYIKRMVKTGEGFTPQIVLWAREKLEVATDPKTGLGYMLIPHHIKFVALDGDTQTTARNLADADNPGLFDKERVKITIIHGVPEDDAAQIFADCNSQGVKVTTSMAIGMDSRDDATQLAKYVEKNVEMLTDKVNRQKRQLSGSDEAVLTMSALRASVVCFLQGINGIQNQTRSVEVDDQHIDALREAAVEWYRAATAALNGALLPEMRGDTFAAAPSVWCAIGAIGHDVMVELLGPSFGMSTTSASIEYAFKAAAQDKIAKVDWTRSEHWLAVGAKQSASGAITLGGPKETGTLVHKALKDGVLNAKAATAAAAA